MIEPQHQPGAKSPTQGQNRGHHFRSVSSRNGGYRTGSTPPQLQANHPAIVSTNHQCGNEIVKGDPPHHFKGHTRNHVGDHVPQYNAQPVISQPSPIRGAVGGFNPVLGQADMKTPLRTRSTPPTASNVQQPRFTPHKSNGPSMAGPTFQGGNVPGTSGNPHHPYINPEQMFGMYQADMYPGSMYPVGRVYMQNTYLQQQQAQRIPIHQPVKRASKALQIFDPNTGKPIVIDASSKPKEIENNDMVASPGSVPVSTTSARAPRSSPSQVSPNNSDLVLSCANNSSSNASYPTSSTSHAAIASTSEPDNATALSTPGVPSSPPADTENRMRRMGSKATGLRSPPTLSPGTQTQSTLSPGTSSSPRPSATLKSLSNATSVKESPAKASTTSHGPPPLDLTESSTPLSVQHPMQPQLSNSKDGVSANSVPEDSGSKSETKPDSREQLRIEIPSEHDNRRYTIEEIISMAVHTPMGLPAGIALDSPCLKQNSSAPPSIRHGFSNSNSGRGPGPDYLRRSSRQTSGLFKSGAHLDQHSCKRTSFRDDRQGGGPELDRSTLERTPIAIPPKFERQYSSKRSSHRNGSGTFTRQEQFDVHPTHVEPLKKSASRWVPRQNQSDDQAVLRRKIKAVLNKLTLEKFEVLSKQFLELVNQKVSSTLHLKTVVELIFDKALSEPTFVKMYSSLCVAISESMPEFQDGRDSEESNSQEDHRSQTFKRMLLNQCQQEFERGTSFHIDPELDRAIQEESLRHQKRRFLGNVRFIGELFKDSMLAERIMHTCIYHFLQEAVQPMEEDIEALCKLLATIGKKFDRPQAKSHIDSYFGRMQMMSTNASLSRRARFMLLDSIDLRRSGWNPRRKEVEAKTIDEFRQEMEREAAQQSRMSRPGSRFDSFPTRGTSPKPLGSRLSRHQTTDRPIHSRGQLGFNLERRGVHKPAITPREGNRASQGPLSRPATIQRHATAPHPLTAPKENASASTDKIQSYKSEMVTAIKDFLKNPGGLAEIRDALIAMIGWNFASRNKEFVCKAINMGMEHGAAERIIIVELLDSLCKEQVISPADINAGFREICEFLSDIRFDIPHAPEYLGFIYGNLVAKGILSLDCFYDIAFDDQVESGVFGEFVANVLRTVAELKSASALQNMFRNSNFDLHVFLQRPFRHHVSDFVKKHDLNEIIPEILIRPSFLSLLENDAPLSEIKEQVRDILVNPDSHRAAAVVARCVLEYCLLSSTYQDADTNTSQLPICTKEARLEESSLLQKYGPLFRQVSGSMQYPESLLFEIHKLCYTLGFPDGLAVRLFKAFDDMGIVPAESYLLWRKQSPNLLGKARAVEEVTAFIDRVLGQ